MVNVCNKQDLYARLPLHLKWLRREVGGERLVCESGADLSDANLRSVDLRGADLRYADLRYADLSSADLSSADLSEADLRYADLSEADLSEADLRYADLSSADLRYADLRSADLSGAKLPVYCKWLATWRTDGNITIGCKTKTVAAWDEWFASDETYGTPRNTADFERIRLAYEHAKGMYEIWAKYEGSES